MEVRLHSLTENDLGAFQNLLGSTDFGGCFCAVWTSFGEDWEKRCDDPSQPNFTLTARNVKNGLHVGYLVYKGSGLVGWTGSGPKTSFPLLKTKLGSRLSDFSDRIWSIGCIAVAKEQRGKSFSEQIVRAVCEEARIRGADLVEAYPARPFHEPRIYRGTHTLYERSGFKEINSEKDGEFDIVLMQLPVKR